MVAALTALRMSGMGALCWEDFSGDEIQLCRMTWHMQIHETKTLTSAASVHAIPFLKRAQNPQHRPTRNAQCVPRRPCGIVKKGVGFRDSEKAPSSSGKQEPKRCRCGDAFCAVRSPCCEADGF